MWMLVQENQNTDLEEKNIKLQVKFDICFAVFWIMCLLLYPPLAI